MARSCEDLTTKQSEPDNNPFLFSNFLKKETNEVETAQVWKTFDSSNESVDQAPFPDLCLNKTGIAIFVFSFRKLLNSTYALFYWISGASNVKFFISIRDYF